jgi:hypothetical protein
MGAAILGVFVLPNKMAEGRSHFSTKWDLAKWDVPILDAVATTQPQRAVSVANDLKPRLDRTKCRVAAW